MTARITLARDPDTQEPVTRLTTSPSQDDFGNSIGGKTVRHFSVKSTTKSGQVKFDRVPSEPRDTVIRKLTFNVVLDSGETFEGLTKRQVNKLLGARQTRKAMSAMSSEDRNTYKGRR